MATAGDEAMHSGEPSPSSLTMTLSDIDVSCYPMCSVHYTFDEGHLRNSGHLREGAGFVE